MDPLRFAIAVVPLAAYLLLVGGLNLRRKPMVVTGAGDLAALGVALTGVAFVGPISLFRPEAATNELGDYVWLFLLAFYLLWVTLLVMLCRPRLVVYNLTGEELRPVLADVVRQLDPAARWAGDNLSLPTLGVHLHLDSVPWMRNTSLVSSGGRQDHAGWRRLGRAVSRGLRGVGAEPNPRGALLLAVGAALLLAATWRLVSAPSETLVAWGQIAAF